jgi:hypothetical protein
MKHSPLKTFGPSLVMLFLSMRLSGAASLTVNMIGSNPTKSPDARYNDGESMILSTTSAGLQFKLQATGYGEDELSPARWGLVDASKPWNRGKEGALIQLGFAPNAVGSTQHNFVGATGTPATMDASYLSIIIDRSSTTMFTSLKVDLVASALALSTTSWGGTSADGFSTATGAVRGPVNAQGRAVSWTFADLNYAGSAPLELRFYGVLGADSSLLKNIVVQGETVPIPESHTVWLVASGALALTVRRRR